METKQTAVELLEIELKNWLEDAICLPDYIFEQAKEMEKEQINKAWENGFRSTGEGWNGEMPPECQGEVLDTEEYYNETYGN
jgi:hypothetical protein